VLPLLALALQGCASGERVSAELTPAAKGSPTTSGALDIPFEKYTLSNGLDVVLHRDTSDPIVAITTLVHVGSSREVPGKTGFAHFFEHMSFNDSENVPRGANRKYIGELGGTRNGGTWNDGTIYYEIVPKDAFEKLLWIDSDRLGYMINTVTEQALENEKQVVKNEKRQRVDNRPYGHTRVVIPSLLYPEDHPYNWPVIGSLEDLQAATLADVSEFYERYYGAANATLVIAGDIDLDYTKELVERWFGEIRRGPEIKPLKPRPVQLKQTKSVFHEDNFAELPELTMTFPTVEQYHPDSYALDALGSLLSSGKRAPLYNVIVEQQQLAPRARASQSSAEIAGTFDISLRRRPGPGQDGDRAGAGALRVAAVPREGSATAQARPGDGFLRRHRRCLHQGLPARLLQRVRRGSGLYRHGRGTHPGGDAGRGDGRLPSLHQGQALRDDVVRAEGRTRAGRRRRDPGQRRRGGDRPGRGERGRRGSELRVSENRQQVRSVGAAAGRSADRHTASGLDRAPAQRTAPARHREQRTSAGPL